MHETVIERFDSRGIKVRVDRELGVLRGVKVLGLESRNGRTYLPEALRGAIALYEGAKVNVNHPKGHPGAPRDYQDRIGVIRDVQLREGAGLFADLHFNPQHALAGQLSWDAEHAPENVGFSHNVQARVVRHGDQNVVEEIAKVLSVDLVADPASTRGLFEGHSLNELGAPTSDAWFAALTLEQLCEQRADIVEAVRADDRRTIAQRDAEIDQLRRSGATRTRRELCRQLLREHRLPDLDSGDATARHLLGEAFLAELEAASDEAAVRRLIADRAQLIESARQWSPTPAAAARPVSRPQNLAEASPAPVTDGRSFARAVTGA